MRRRGRTPAHRCPHCASDDIERVHGRSWDWIPRAFGFRVYHCRQCGRRFYNRPSQREAS